MSMMAIMGTSLFKLKITYGSAYKRTVFYSSLVCFSFYAIVYWLKAFNIYEVPLTDLLVVIFLVLSMEKV